MSDEALANAFAELHSLQNRHKEIDEQITAANAARNLVSERISKAAEFIVAWHRFSGKPEPTLESVLTGYKSVDAIMTTPAPLKVTGNPKKEIVAEAALLLVQERGKPISRPEIFQLLKDRGLEVRGAEPLVTLSTMLWRAGTDAGLIHLKGHGYWDAAQAYALAGYVPNHEDSSGDPPPEYDVDLEYDAMRERQLDGK